MFKQLALATTLLTAYAATAQEETTTSSDKLSLELQLGLNNPVNPVGAEYDAKSFGFFHTGLGARYMFNSSFGGRLQTGFDNLKGSSDSKDFSTNYFRVSVEGVVNAGNVFHFYEWTDRFSVLMHLGAGYSIMKEKESTVGADNMMHALAGITPQFRLTDRWVLSLDATSIAHIYQSRTYDFSETNPKRGVDGYLFNLSVGIQYNFGTGRHADWTVPMNLSGELQSLDSKIAALHDQQKDTDGDGVPDYLDQEPGTAEGAIVNTKGQTQTAKLKDSDSDGVSDDADECPFAKGTEASKGCPDADGDGVSDKTDACPNLPGTVNSGGCPDVAPETQALLASAGRSLQFAAGKQTVPAGAKEKLDEVARMLLMNSDYKLQISVHSGAEGDNLQNLALTQRRADAVKYYLAGKGISGDRIVALGFGETQPVADISTKEGNALNERAELIIRF